MQQLPRGVDELRRPFALRPGKCCGERLARSLIRLDDVREMQAGLGRLVEGGQRGRELNVGNSCVHCVRVLDQGGCLVGHPRDFMGCARCCVAQYGLGHRDANLQCLVGQGR
jgi:hypothetical protein